MLRDGTRPDSRQEVNIQGSNNKECVLQTHDVSYLPCLVCCIDILAEKFSFNSSPLLDHSKRVLGFVVRELRHSGLRFRTTKPKTLYECSNNGELLNENFSAKMSMQQTRHGKYETSFV